MSKTIRTESQPRPSPTANRAQCQFPPPPGGALTVGQVVQMHCRWPSDLSLKPPVSIEPVKGAPFRLVILKTKSLKPGEGVFEVTGYEPGEYNTPVTLMGGEGGRVVSRPVSWSMDSVLKPGTVKPYPPYGPWLEEVPYPLWWGLGACVVLMLALGIRKAIQQYKRKKWLQTLPLRTGGKDPLFILTSQLNQLTRKASVLSMVESMKQLKTCFMDFLENEGAGPLKDLSFRKTLREVKKFEGLSPLQKKRILEFLTEWEKSFSVSEHIGPEDLNRLLVRGREVAIDIHSPGSAGPGGGKTV